MTPRLPARAAASRTPAAAALSPPCRNDAAGFINGNQPMRFIMLAILPITLLAGCAEESRQAPVSTAFRGVGAGSQEPEPANSLPRGASVDAPLTSPVGNIASTRVGPATPGAGRITPSVTSRY